MILASQDLKLENLSRQNIKSIASSTMTAPVVRPTSRKRLNVFTLMFFFLGFCAVVMVVLLHSLIHLDVNCEKNKDCAGATVPSSSNHQQVITTATATDTTADTTTDTTSYIPPATLTEWKLDYYGPDTSIQAYNPTHHPVFARKDKLKVRLFTEVFNNQVVPMNECKHILYDGLLESEALDLQGVTYTLKNECKQNDWDESWKDDDLWVLDSHHVLESCDVIHKWMQQTLKLRDNKPWMILAVDYGDDNQVNQCTNIAESSASNNWYRVAKRSIGVGREWDEASQFPKRGKLVVQKTTTPILHLPYPVRTDLARDIAEAVTHAGFQSPLTIPNRVIDVSHFYARQTNVAVKAYYDNLRNGINVILKFMDGAPLAGSGGRKLATFCGLAGKDKKMGRNIVSSEYVKIMLKSKIIVVAQRDGWSDHYRLMEALSSGAMVIADETLILPRGLRHAESLVIFDSFSDLREKLFYYVQHDTERLKIAQRGWEIAMGYHRSWHALESVIFGQPITHAGDAMAAFQKDLTPRTEPSPPLSEKQRQTQKGGN